MKTIFLLVFVASVASAQDAPDGAKQAAHEFILAHLKAPATAIFSSESACGPVTVVPNASDPSFPILYHAVACPPVQVDSMVMGYQLSVDAQNSYGALIRTSFRLHLSMVSGHWVVSFLHDALQAHCDELTKSAVDQVKASGKKLPTNYGFNLNQECRRASVSEADLH